MVCAAGVALLLLVVVSKFRSQPDKGDFKSHRFLCDQWSGKTGASVARAGAAPDKLPGELMEIHGDGTEGLPSK